MMKVLSRLRCLVLCLPVLVMGQEMITWQEDGSEMVLLPAGSFMLGSNDEDDDEKTALQVELDGFYIDANEVTVGQLKKFVNRSGYSFRNGDGIM